MAKERTLAAEIEAAEKKIYGDHADEASAIASEETSEETEEQSTESAGGEAEDSTQEEELDVTTASDEDEDDTDDDATSTEPKKRVSWKKRFVNYKASSDATITGLRQERLYDRERIAELEDQIREFATKLAATSQKDPYDGLFTQEEIDLIGEDTLRAMQKANQAALDAKVKPLQEQLDKEAQHRRKLEEQERKREEQALGQQFLTKLGKLVPDYQTIDTDPKFLKWMTEQDEYSGYPRELIFKRAHANGDVRRVAEFFQEFKETTKPVNKLEDKVTPNSSRASTPPKQRQQTNKPKITQRFILNFYDDVSRGKYRKRQKEQLAIEKAIDDHLHRTAMGRRR